MTKTEESATTTLSSECTLPQRSTTEVSGSSPMRTVPMTWRLSGIGVAPTPWYETPGEDVWITHSAPISSSTDCRILPWYFDAASSC